MLTALLFGLNQAVHLDSPSCSIHFSVNNAGFEVEGIMQVVHADINFDPEKLGKSVVSIKADPSSVDTGIPIRDKHLLRKDFFDVKEYPEIHLKSKRFYKKSSTDFVGIFDLTIKSITKEVEIPFRLKRTRAGNQYDANFIINRLDFNVGEKSLTIEDKVEVTVTIVI
jgi:polyisoprenoid-binding protein YceI